MRNRYDVVIVGAGLFGCTCAYELTKDGFCCLVLEKRSHIGGNCYTEMRDNIRVHVYGPHIFHTSSARIWDWINRFARFNHYRHHVKVNFEGRIYSFPPNLSTFNQLWNINTPAEAKRYLERVRRPCRKADNLERWALSVVGQEIYDTFIRGYTEKQWDKPGSNLPPSIIQRIPIRLTYDDSYFNDCYQGIPMEGYTPIFDQLLTGVEVKLNTDYFDNSREFNSKAKAILYTGPIDRFFNYSFGRLEYRSIRFEHQRFHVPDFQGVAQMNFTSARVPYTRVIEHKHFDFGKQPVTWVTKEYPVACPVGGLEMYPVRDNLNLRLLEKYSVLRKRAEQRNYYFGGRLADYKYYDMHQVIGAALKCAKEINRDLRQISLRTNKSSFPLPSQRDLPPTVIARPW